MIKTSNTSRCVRQQRQVVVLTSMLATLAFAYAAKAAELSVESEVDSTPSELRQLSDRAQALEAKIRELEKRVAESQKTILGPTQKELIDYRLELKPPLPAPETGLAGKPLVVSHVRMSLDGRAFVYTQSAVIVSEKYPLPLFIGKISEGSHQIRLQYQVAPLTENVFTTSGAGWRTVDQVVNLEIVSAAGKQQIHAIQIADEATPVMPQKKIENSKDSLPRVIDKMREVR